MLEATGTCVGRDQDEETYENGLRAVDSQSASTDGNARVASMVATRRTGIAPARTCQWRIRMLRRSLSGGPRPAARPTEAEGPRAGEDGRIQGVRRTYASCARPPPCSRASYAMIADERGRRVSPPNARATASTGGTGPVSVAGPRSHNHDRPRCRSWRACRTRTRT